MNKSEMINIRLSTSEKQILEKKILESGFKYVTDYIRHLLFSEENCLIKKTQNNQDVLLNRIENLEIHLLSMENSLKEFAQSTVNSSEEIMEKFFEIISKYMYKNLLFSKIIINLFNNYLVKFQFSDDPSKVENWKKTYDLISEKSKEKLDGELKEND